MLHSMETLNYLKIDPENYISVSLGENGSKIISIEHEYLHTLTGGKETETRFWKLQNIKIQDLSLRELMVLYSLYVCKTSAQIIETVMDQPSPGLFYKSCYELDF